MLQHVTIAFIGAGMMGEAMIAGLLKEQLVPADQIIATGPRPERREALHEKYGIRVTDDNREAAQTAERVRAAIAALPAGQRAAVALFHLGGLSHAEVAGRLGTRPGAVKTRLHKARGVLRHELVDVHREEFPMPIAVPMSVADVRRPPTARSDRPASAHRDPADPAGVRRGRIRLRTVARTAASRP